MKENGLAGQFFEALQLKGNGRLGAAKEPCRLRYASGFNDRNQGPEHSDIQADEVHVTVRRSEKLGIFYAISMLERAGRCVRAAFSRD
jgi:hypothetical protein